MKKKFIISVLLFTCLLSGCKQENPTFKVSYNPLNDNNEVMKMIGGYSGNMKLQSLNAKHIRIVVDYYKYGELHESLSHNQISIIDEENYNIYYEYENGVLNILIKEGGLCTFELIDFLNIELKHYAMNYDDQIYDAEFDLFLIYEESDEVDSSSLENIKDTSAKMIIVKCYVEN